MRIDGQAGPAALFFKTLEKNPAAELSTLVDRAAVGNKEQAKPAAPNAFFPTSVTGALDLGTILHLQGDPPAISPKADSEKLSVTPTEEFLAYMQKTPEERLRENILKSMGLTEEDLEGMPPEQRKAIEDKIREIIKEKLTSGAEVEDSQQTQEDRIRAQLFGLEGQNLA